MITLQQIKDLDPCYNPAKYAPDNWEGTAQDILRDKRVPPDDRLWVVCREEFIGKDLLFKFAENCCGQIVNYLPEDEQLEYCNVLSIIRIAREDNDHELRDAAWGAARGAAWDAAWGAAWDAAWGAAGDEFCYMLADMIDGTFEDFYLIDRLEKIREIKSE